MSCDDPLQVKRVEEPALPIDVLPPELLRQVILCYAGPQDHHKILRLASVCGLWRASVFAERSLFAAANWADWPFALLELWNSRSRGCPLTVRIDVRVALRLVAEKDYAHLLRTTSHHWATLDLLCSLSRKQGSALASLQHLLARCQLCSLHILNYTSPRHGRIQLVATDLRTLRCIGPPPILLPGLGHLASIRICHLRPSSWADWNALESLLSNCHTSLIGLRLNASQLHSYMAHEWTPSMEISFSSLQILRFDSAFKGDITHSLRLCTFPLLTEITLDMSRYASLGEPNGIDELIETLEFLVSMSVTNRRRQCFTLKTISYHILQSKKAPCVQRLRLVPSRRDWTACRLLLAYLGTDLSVLPMLNDLYMSAGHPWVLTGYPFTDYEEIVLRFVARRKITRLAIPHLDQALVDKLGSEYDVLVTPLTEVIEGTRPAGIF